MANFLFDLHYFLFMFCIFCTSLHTHTCLKWFGHWWHLYSTKLYCSNFVKSTASLSQLSDKICRRFLKTSTTIQWINGNTSLLIGHLLKQLPDVFCQTFLGTQLGIPIPGSRILGSWTIFSIPNPGIGDALIPGFRDYETRTKCRNFTWYLLEKYPFPEFWGPIPGSKAESERTRDPNTKYVIKWTTGHHSTGTLVLNKLFKCLFMLLYSISLDE